MTTFHIYEGNVKLKETTLNVPFIPRVGSKVLVKINPEEACFYQVLLVTPSFKTEDSYVVEVKQWYPGISPEEPQQKEKPQKEKEN
jgi:hypothetical protein